LATESIAGARPSDSIVLRAMTAADLKAAHQLSVSVHWPHRLVDWELAFELGNGLVAEHDGRLVGTALGWPWDADHATLGLVIVDPRCPGQRIGWRLSQRIGWRLMQALVDALGGRSILLHATREARGLYERLGFVPCGEVHQHQGKALPAPLVALKEGWRLRPSTQNDLARIVTLDAEARGMRRDTLISRLLASAQTVVLDRDGHACGFAMLRRFGRGVIIGPVVAPDTEGAKALIAYMAGLNAGKFVRIDVDAGSGLGEWLRALGLPKVDAPAAMVGGALVSQALG
jgi:GNAT superfamily N-acetyltransferase